MFDDLRDPQPTEPRGGFDPAEDPLLADLPGTSEPLPDEDLTIPAFDGPRFGDEVTPVRTARRPGGQFMGLSAQQRAVLSVFLFLDVSVLGCVLLMAAGAVSIP